LGVLLKQYDKRRRGYDLSMSKIEIEIRQRINQKLEEVGANSKKNALPLIEANLDLQELYWLPYLVGNVLGRIRKTEDNRYYCC